MVEKGQVCDGLALLLCLFNILVLFSYFNGDDFHGNNHGCQRLVNYCFDIVGPVLAVQAQKAVEVFREIRNRKMRVFSTLMATRAARLSGDHVQALNMIDLAFYGQSVFGVKRRKKSEQAVLDAWKEYLDLLGTDQSEVGGAGPWSAQRDELFVNLLYAIAKDVDYSFDRVQIKKGAYSPIGHGELEAEQAAIRRSMINALSGETTLKMEIVSLPAEKVDS